MCTRSAYLQRLVLRQTNTIILFEQLGLLFNQIYGVVTDINFKTFRLKLNLK